MKRISPYGFLQGDMVRLLDKTLGNVWIPVSAFNDIGNAAYAQVGASTPYGMAFDAATDEHIDTSWLVPKNMDVSKEMRIYVYWSSDNTTASKGVVWDIDYTARAIGEDVGIATTNVTAGADTDSTTADDLNISPAITIPADTFAAVNEILFLSLFRDAGESADDVAVDAEFYGIRIEYTTLPSISSVASRQHADLTRGGYTQNDLVKLLEKSVGQMWVPIAEFNDIGGTSLAAIDSSRVVGMLFDQTTDEHIDTTLLVPADMDVSKAASIYVYWSSGNTSASKNCTWNIDYTAREVGQDVGVAVTNATAGADTDSETADALNASPVISIPANTFASNDELLFLSLFRDVDESDDLAVDAALYGIRIDYTTKPTISTSLEHADIVPRGVHIGKIVELVDKMVGRLWIPISKFSDNGGGTLAATGGVRAVGMTFDTGADEAVEIALLAPQNMDVNHPAYITVYWSSADTDVDEDCQWAIDYIAIGAGDDVGATDATIDAEVDDNSGTADLLQTAEVITIPADTLASVNELLFLSLRRDVSEDDLSSDASVYGVRIDYTCDPSIKS